MSTVAVDITLQVEDEIKILDDLPSCWNCGMVMNGPGSIAETTVGGFVCCSEACAAAQGAAVVKGGGFSSVVLDTGHGEFVPITPINFVSVDAKLNVETRGGKIDHLVSSSDDYFFKKLSELFRMPLFPTMTLPAPIKEPTEGERLAAFFARSEHEGQPSVRREAREARPTGNQWWRISDRTRDPPEKLAAAARSCDDFVASLDKRVRLAKQSEQLAALRDDFDNLPDA